MAEEETSSLEATPTWAIAAVCFFMIFVSIFIEHLFHLLAKYFNKKRRKSLFQALNKIKTELMLLGFISLLLTICEKSISNICIPKSVGQTFLPCGDYSSSIDEEEEESKCADQGKDSLLSRTGVRELNYLIFVLASFHTLSCILTFALGVAKMRTWKLWEAETKTLEYQYSKDPRRFQLTHQTSFGKRHLRWSQRRILRWLVFFLRQFCGSVYKVDYLTLRHGFITAHFEEGSNFDFQEYIKRALENDFKVVVGISFWIWVLSVFFIFFNAHLFYSYLWLPFIPLVMLLLVGTKLQAIITSMGLESHDKSHVVRGTLLVRPSDELFWFGCPKLLLHLMHFILFQNSFQLAYFTWTWYTFGFRSCFHRKTEDIVIRIVMGVLVHFLCGYVTLPLYALVTQMGTSMRGPIFSDNVVMGLRSWRGIAKKNAAKNSHDMSLTKMGTSMRGTIFSDNVVMGLRSWRGKAKKNAAKNSHDMSPNASPTSLDMSPSLSVHASPYAFHTEIVAIQVEDESGSSTTNNEHNTRVASFEGFRLDKESV